MDGGRCLASGSLSESRPISTSRKSAAAVYVFVLLASLTGWSGVSRTFRAVLASPAAACHRIPVAVCSTATMIPGIRGRVAMTLSTICCRRVCTESAAGRECGGAGAANPPRLVDSGRDDPAEHSDDVILR